MRSQVGVSTQMYDGTAQPRWYGPLGGLVVSSTHHPCGPVWSLESSSKKPPPVVTGPWGNKVSPWQQRRPPGGAREGRLRYSPRSGVHPGGTAGNLHS